jgi:hypothetical protein
VNERAPESSSGERDELLSLVGGGQDVDLLSPGHVVHLPGSEGVEPCAGQRAAAAAQAGRPLRGNILAEADSGQRQVAPAQRHHLHYDVVPEQTQRALNKRKKRRVGDLCRGFCSCS